MFKTEVVQSGSTDIRQEGKQTTRGASPLQFDAILSVASKSEGTSLYQFLLNKKREEKNKCLFFYESQCKLF